MGKGKIRRKKIRNTQNKNMKIMEDQERGRGGYGLSYKIPRKPRKGEKKNKRQYNRSGRDTRNKKK